MASSNTFNHVNALADDAITVRITNVDGKLGASIDFPTFQHPDGKFYKANRNHQYPVSAALSQANQFCLKHHSATLR
ncbi:hypothetical protein [Rhizobium sp. No.120]